MHLTLTPIKYSREYEQLTTMLKELIKQLSTLKLTNKRKNKKHII